MEKKLVNLIIGSLLHDIGKIIHRTGIMQSHSYLGWDFLSEITSFRNNDDIKECVKYHHGRELVDSKVDNSSLAYITYIADNISASGDRRADMIEGEVDTIKSSAIFDKSAPLSSVFNILNGHNEKYTYPFKMLGQINYPVEERRVYTPGHYSEIKVKIKEQLEGIEISKYYINSVLHLLEATTSFVPSSTNTKELMDISFFDHSKTTAAIASCLYYYLKEVEDKTGLLKNEKEFRQEDAFLLYSCDISGIQNYIYTISGTEALKSLRARSLYLELLLENIVDELLMQTGLSRCNLMYTGGGHAYLLLPNTKCTIAILEHFEEELKSWFISNFDISLYIACGYTKCNSIELSEDIGKAYDRVGKNIAIKKSQRYTVDDIIKLNSNPRKVEERECRECKKTGAVSEEGKCDICHALIEISPQVTKKNTFFVVFDHEVYQSRDSLPLPFGQVLAIKEIDEIRGKNYIRVYSKNQPSMGYNFATNLWVGDYSVRSNKYYGARTFEEFAEEAMGINRIAVLRADVDNLGRAFVSGFKEQKNREILTDSKRKYETISRTATLSRQLSMFFKFYINDILKVKDRNATIIYSGGDDMFIVGSWNDVIDLAKDIKDAFNRYTQETLTISSGIGIYPHSFPISRIATEVGELENLAKTKDENKNKVTLFRKSKLDGFGNAQEEDWILEWDQLPRIEADENPTDNKETGKGIEEKLNILRNVFAKDEERGKAFIYKLLELLRDSRNDRINIARYAYILKRAENRNPKLDIPKFYSYIKNTKERKELEIAITLYSYETRN